MPEKTIFRRFTYKGKQEDREKMESLIKDIDRGTVYAIFKNFEINPAAIETLKEEFPDI